MRDAISLVVLAYSFQVLLDRASVLSLLDVVATIRPLNSVANDVVCGVVDHFPLRLSLILEGLLEIVVESLEGRGAS